MHDRHRTKDRRRKTRVLALSAMLSACGVVLLALGAVLEVLDLSVAVLASVLTVVAVLEIGGYVYPLMIYAVTSVLSFILMPQNSGAYCYFLFFGFYPILKSLLERKKIPQIFSWICKVILFNLSYSVFVFLVPLILKAEPYAGGWYLVLMYVGGNLLFVLYEITLTKLITLYIRHLRIRLHMDRFWKS